MKRVKLYLLVFLLLLGVNFLLYYYLIREPGLRKQLLSKGRYTIATITGISHGKHSTTMPQYLFRYNQQTFEGYGNSIIQKQESFYFDDNYKGRKYYVIFLPDHPDKNSILPYCIPPDSLVAPEDGWDHLPTEKLRFVIGTTEDE